MKPTSVSSVRVLPLRTPTLLPATHTNAWVLGRERVIVVEPGSPYAEEQARLRGALAGHRVSAIVLTHHHADHTGGVDDLRDHTGAIVLAHAATAERVSSRVDRELAEGDVLEDDTRAWQVLHTPGHAPGHVCLWSPQDGAIICGDMVASEGTILVAAPDGHLGTYMASLERLEELDPRVLLPAHGPPILDAVVRLREYIEHRRARTEQCIAQLRMGSKDPLGIARQVYRDLVPEAFLPLAALQVSSHLQWLAEQGQAREVEGVWELCG